MLLIDLKSQLEPILDGNETERVGKMKLTGADFLVANGSELSKSRFMGVALHSALALFFIVVLTSCGPGKYQPLSFSGNQNEENDSLVSQRGGGDQAPSDPSVEDEDGESFDPDRFNTKGSGGMRGTTAQNCQIRNQTRPFRTFVPQSYSNEQSWPLVVAIHGLGDDYRNFDDTLRASGWHSLAEKEGFLLMTPSPGNSERESFLHLNGPNELDKEATKQEAEDVLTCVYYTFGSLYNLDTTKIHFIGMSEGAVFTAYVAVSFSQQIKSVGLYAGALGYGTKPARLMPVFFLTGTADFSFSAIQNVAGDWSSAGHPTDKHFPTGIGHTFSGLSNSIPPATVWKWLDQTAASTPVESAYRRPTIP